jgi:hypothetical protein
VDVRWCLSRFKLAISSYYWPSVSAVEIVEAEEVLVVEGKLLANLENKERFLETSKTNILERIIGFKFGMDDKNADAKEAAKNVKMVEEDLKRNALLILQDRMKVIDFFVDF